MESIPLLGTTRARILRELRKADQNAVQVARTLGLQVSAARKHLDRLRALGFVDERFERRGPGRPKKLFRLTDEGHELFSRGYDSVLNAVLSTLEKERGGEYVEEVMGRIAAASVESIGDGPGVDPEHLRRLVAGLREMGFEPSLKQEDGTCVITSRNCPILKAARAHRELVCRGLHAEVIRRATGVPRVDRGAWIVDGDAVCVHSFPVRGSPSSAE